jgi:hypothetical protein
MRAHAKAKFAVACTSVIALGALFGGGSAPFAGADLACPNEALRVEQHATLLPDCRAYEMVSPPDKNGGDVIGSPPRTHAAEDGNAITFASLNAFGDVVGSGVAVDYMAVRSASPGDSGWSTHAITPPQASSSVSTGILSVEPLYASEFSPDLSTGVFRAWSPVTSAPEVDGVRNIYLRDDLRTPGAGHYQLLSGCPVCLSSGESLLERAASKSFAEIDVPALLGATPDFGHVFFESKQALTADAPAGPLAHKLYEVDHGVLRLTGILPTGAAAEHVLGGRGVTRGPTAQLRHVNHAVSKDGSRVIFTAPPDDESIEGDLYMRIDGNSTIRLDASERSVPEAPRPSAYWDAAADGSRVFFSSYESLTDASPAFSNREMLYMWKRAEGDERQSVTVDASGGTFKLSFEGAGTAQISFDASAAAVQAALEALKTVKAGNVDVSGGPGSPGGATPYAVTFSGDFAGTNVAQLKANGSSLSGGAATATVATTDPVNNLTYLNVDHEPADGNDVIGVIGASDDGRYLYFGAIGQLVAGAPKLATDVMGLYLWHEGTLSYIGKFAKYQYDMGGLFDGGFNGGSALLPRQAEVTPDGRHLLFNASFGEGLLSAHGGVDYDHGDCVGPFFACREHYLYSADSNTLQCATCNPSGAPATASAGIREIGSIGGSILTNYLAHSLSDDGRHVFFTTAEKLVPGDTNSVRDAYEFDSQSGEVHLLSSGTSKLASYFMEVSPSGDDAFFITAERLVGWDVDGSYDLYDARVGGGFPEPVPVPAPCLGESCRGTSPSPPSTPAAGSSVLRGAGDQIQPRGCPKGRRTVHRGGKTRCLKKKRHKQNANANRKADR